MDGVVCDVGTFRVVEQADLVSRQFDGHPFAARQGIAQAEQRGWIVRQPAQGPTGRPYTVIVATPAGAARAAVLWARAGRADQRVFSGAVKVADVGHEVAVYRAACAAQARQLGALLGRQPRLALRSIGAACLTHFVSADGVRSSSRATAPTVLPSSKTSRTAPVLNSSLNCRRARRPALRDPILPGSCAPSATSPPAARRPSRSETGRGIAAASFLSIGV